MATGPARPLDLGLPSHEKKKQLFIKLDRLMSTVGVLDSGRKRTLADGVRMFFNRNPLNNKDLGFLLRTFNLFQKHLEEIKAERKP